MVGILYKDTLVRIASLNPYIGFASAGVMIETIKQIAEGGSILIYLAAIYLLGRAVIFMAQKFLKNTEEQLKKKDLKIAKLEEKLEDCQQDKLKMQIDFSNRLLENEKTMIESYEILAKIRS